MANEATLARPATVSPPERASSFPAATTAMPPASPPMAAEIAELLARGDLFVVIGDIASARVFYERAANAGDGRAALRMGTTFDPAFLRRAGLPRTFGDPAQARSWYRRAFDLDELSVGGMLLKASGPGTRWIKGLGDHQQLEFALCPHFSAAC